MSQLQVVLGLLRERGPRGVSAHELIYEHGITRGASIINILRDHDYDILTVDDGKTADGRQKLARYVLRGAPGRTQPNAELPPAADLPFPCGCVRSRSGQGWLARCLTHSTGVLAP
jgi:hypothetical protein